MTLRTIGFIVFKNLLDFVVVKKLKGGAGVIYRWTYCIAPTVIVCCRCSLNQS